MQVGCLSILSDTWDSLWSGVLFRNRELFRYDKVIQICSLDVHPSTVCGQSGDGVRLSFLIPVSLYVLGRRNRVRAVVRDILCAVHDGRCCGALRELCIVSVAVNWDALIVVIKLHGHVSGQSCHVLNIFNLFIKWFTADRHITSVKGN